MDGSPGVSFSTGSAATEYTLTGLEPYQLVQVQITASTAVGEGPKSNATEGRSMEPGTVLICNYTFIPLSEE